MSTEIIKNIAEIVCLEMGCSASVADTVDVAGADLHLPHSKLKFTVAQLKCLNNKLNNLGDDLRTQYLTEDAESIAERLIQGLVCGAAAKDSRFNSKFMIVLHKDRICKSSSLEYLVLLDDLDGNCSVAEGPPGCARLRPQEHVLHKWQDFLTPSGFLRRDKVIERWVEVLAAAAADGIIGSDLSSEAHSTTAPGYIVQSCILQRLRNLKPHQQCFYGNAKESQFPSPRDYRIAIVEGNPWVRIRLAGGALAGGAEAKLTLGTAYHGWPAGSDFPSRIPIGHLDALSFYRAAQTGFFVVGGGPGSGVQWSERCAGWQIWAAGARSVLAARGEGFLRITRICTAVLDHLRATGQPPLRAVSRFMIEEALLWKVEKSSGRVPAGDLRSWTANHLAHHVLCVFDTLLGQIRSRTGRHYFFHGCDMIKMTVWRSARISERDWRGDADCLANFLKRMHEDSGKKIEEGTETFPSVQERLESALCSRWSLLLQELTPAGSTKGRRLAGAPPYSPRQLSYVAAVARELLAARQLVIQESNDWYQGSLTTISYQRQDPIEDLIHLLAIILDQARDYFLKTNFPNNLFTKTTSKDNKTALLVKNTSSKDTIKRHKLKNCYDAASAYLLDSVRRDPETQKEDLVNDSILVRTLLRWLYKAVDDDKKYLSPVLKPYLDLLFMTSHENCWHLEEFKSRVCEKELESLQTFCSMVGEGTANPADGILEAASKGWIWAENILDTLNIVSSINSALRILFATPNGKILKFDLSLPKDIREREIWNTFYINRKDSNMTKLKLAEKCVVEAFAYGLDRESGYGSTVLSSKSEEILHGGKFDLNFGDVSNTHTLRSVKSMKFDGNHYEKYHTLRSVNSKYNTLRNSENIFGSYWTNGSTLRMKNKPARPTVLGELNVAEHETNSETIDDVEYSLHCHLRDFSPMNTVLSTNFQLAPHREYTGVVKALIAMQRYSVLQELAGWLGDGGERAGALKALHRLARGGRRASGPCISSTLQPSLYKHNYTLSPKKNNAPYKQRASIRQYYRRRNIDALSGDEGNNKKTDKKSTTSTDSSKKSQTETPTPRTREEELDLEVQREYLQNKELHDLGDHNASFKGDYLEMCREVIRESNAKLSQSSIMNLDRNESKKSKVSKKGSNRSLSVGRSGGKDVKAQLSMSSTTLGKSTGKEMKISMDSLLGTCREARLQHAARKSILPRTGSAGDGLFGDAFKVSPFYSSVQSEYDLMTQSILQNAGAPTVGDRQKSLTQPIRDKFYP